MGYCEIADVTARLPDWLTIDDSSDPTTAEVEKWIAETSAKANGALKRAGYETVPVTGENDLLMLRGVVADKVALQTLYVALGADKVPDSAKETLSGFRDFIAGLSNGQAWLIDQVPASSAAGNLEVGSITLTSAYYEDD